VRSVVLPFALLVAACSDDPKPVDHPHEYTNYAQCYNHRTRDEDMAPQRALDDCDEYFADVTDFADREACTTFYADYPDVPEGEAALHCDALFPSG